MCKCVDFLMRPQEIPGQKGLYSFVDSGIILNLETGQSGVKPVLRAIKEGKDGRRTLARPYMPMRYCPSCGEKVEAWADIMAPEDHLV